MNEFNPNCGRCGMLNSRGFCSLTACRYPSNVIVSEPKVIRGMMVNPQIEKPQTNADRIRAMTDEELAVFLCDNVDCAFCEEIKGNCTVGCKDRMLLWLKDQVEKGG